jgi:two-component system response regulator PilR (NtrC family)
MKAAASNLAPGPWPPVPDDQPAKTPRILVADDERSMRELLAIVLKREGYDVVVAENGSAALAVLKRGHVDLLISDIKMPDMSGVEVLRAAKAADAAVPAIMMTAFASTETAVEAMRLGACDYLVKPFDVDELKLKVREKLEARQLRQENVLLKRALNKPVVMDGIIGSSSTMLAVFDLIESVAKTTSTVLVTGESGTGKELVARALHFHSLRRERPFVALNCGALPETLLESELFGHMRGAFTGAEATKKGLVEVAEGGTIFLDEIGEMTPMMQVKLLRVLQERRFRRVGGTEEIAADIRVVAATNQDLPKLVAEGRFREDLYYRINVIPIQLPALRERREDIPLIAQHFLEKYREQMGKPLAAISGDAMALLERYHWPGNIRELENVVERAVALERTPTILPESLPPQIRGTQSASAGASDIAPLPDAGFDLEQHVQNVEKRYLAQALERAGGVQVRAAELLGMSFRSFRYYAKKYNLK